MGLLSGIISGIAGAATAAASASNKNKNNNTSTNTTQNANTSTNKNISGSNVSKPSTSSNTSTNISSKPSEMKTHRYNGINYTFDVNKDYQSAINNATSIEEKAQLERERNAKISWMNNNNKNVNNYQYTNNYSQNVTHNGIEFNPSTNYQELINKAIENGDYVEASRLNQQRNAKIDYAQGNGTATDGLKSIDSLYSSINQLPDTWKTALIDGKVITKGEDGKIYGDNNTLLGSGYNDFTGEYTFDNVTDARNAMLRDLADGTRLGDYNTQDFIDYMNSLDVYNQNLIQAYMNGEVGNYMQNMQSSYDDYQEYLAKLEEWQRYQEEQERLKQEQELDVEEYLNKILASNLSNSDNGYSSAYDKYIKKNLARTHIY